jgi:flagellar hook-associated protein 2
MGGISGSGLISGIDTATLIEQLIAASSRPKVLAQSRLIQLQSQQAAYLDLNSQLGALRSAASAFRTGSVFQTKKATSSNSDILTATANLGAQPGTYTFVVDRLVSTRQLLSRGFQDRDVSAIGAESFTFESYEGRLDRDLSLSVLNDGAGIERGKIRISDGTDSAEVDLSRAGTVNDVVTAINSSGLNVTARVREGRFEIVGATSVTNAGVADTAGSLGLSSGSGASAVGGVWTGARVYEMTASTTLASLNDGNGVDYNARTTVTEGVAPDFRVTVNGVTVSIGLGEVRERDDNGTPGDTSDDTFPVVEPAVSSVEGLLERINSAFTDAGLTGTSAAIDADSGALTFTSTDGNIESIQQVGSAKTVRDLGLTEFTGGTTATVTGSRIFAGLGTTLIRGLNGGGSAGGIGGDGRLFFQTRDGNSFTIDLGDGDFDTVEGLIDFINSSPDNSGAITASLNAAGTGIKITDSSGGSGNLVITGFAGNDTAESLGISTGAAGIASSSVNGTSLQRRYFSEATRLDSLRNGQGIGEGTIRIIDSSGVTAEVIIDDNEITVADLIAQIQSQASSAGLQISVGINEKGDGLKITDTSGTGNAIRVEDASGSVAANLRIAGEAGGVGAENYIDGSFETTVEFDAADTLDDVVSKINDADAGVRVSVLNDGSGARPYRLSISADQSGVAGRFTLDTNGFNLGATVLDEGEDSRVFFGSSNAETGILLTSSSNTLDDVITGVNIDLVSASNTPVSVTVTDDTATIEGKVKEFIDAYNRVLTSIERTTRFDQETGDRGALLGDGLVLGLRGGLFGTLQSTNRGFTGAFSRLSQVGIRPGTDGKLELDSERFREALAQNPEAVEDLFTRRTIDEDPQQDDSLPDGVTVNDPNAEDVFSELGAVVLIEEFAKNYVDSINGVLTARTQSLDTQIRNQQSRIDSIQEGLDRQREALTLQFIGMERALAQLQSQQAALASISLLG